ncbi:MAG: putative Na+/H+ antiporter [Rhizobacter sp.]|nr:putative Na+/H+ antiporter [Rhizobacter sp.]
MNPTTLQIIGAALFAVALAHTFSTSVFAHLAHRYPRHEGMFHLLAEVEVVFGFWALVLVLLIFAIEGKDTATHYLDSRNFTEPLFVFAIMVVAGSKPILELASRLVDLLARLSPIPTSMSVYFLALSLIPLMGSFVTEPAAMTLAALMLRDRVFCTPLPERLKYATVGVLFVNVSIGGTLTSFAAPPVLMVASKWSWDTGFMLSHFGWKAAIAVLLNAAVVTLMFANTLVRAGLERPKVAPKRGPFSAMVVSALFLLGIVTFAHHPAVFMGLLLFFIGYSAAYPRHHDTLILREALLVAFFLAGLVVLGGQQQWWLQSLLTSMSPRAVYYGATALTAVTDNAALTYLASLVDGLSDEFKYSIVAGAVTGGGLTVIANAPNPAGYSILRGVFSEGAIRAGWLLVAAAGPTLVAIAAFRLL